MSKFLCEIHSLFYSRSGAFDWLVGRQEDDSWHYDRRFLREFTGMSLRGLAWTAPQGYALQLLGFGWEYSLSGSLMGFVYFLGSKTPLTTKDDHFETTFDASTAYAEYYWGTWIWFVLIIACLSQVVRRMHIWIYSKKEYLGFKPFSMWEKMKYESLNRSLSRGTYETFMLLFNGALMSSVVYYSLVQQKDQRNKGQTFFGLFTGVLLLTFLQGWVYNMLYIKLKDRRLRQKMHIPSISSNLQNGGHRTYTSPRASPRIPDLDNLESAAAISNGENKPLLGWYPRSSPTPDQRRNMLSPPEHALSNIDVYRPHLQLGTVEPATTTTAVLILWPTLEKWVWMDVFIWVRRVIGLVSFLATLNTVIVSTAALFWGMETARYLHPNCTYTYGSV